MTNLKELNSKIYDLETEKTKLKYEGLEKAKLDLLRMEQDKETFIHLAEVQVYLNDTDKVYKNDTARKLGVRELTNHDSFKNKEAEITACKHAILKTEQKIKLMQKEIDYLKRELQIELLQEGKPS